MAKPAAVETTTATRREVALLLVLMSVLVLVLLLSLVMAVALSTACLEQGFLPNPWRFIFDALGSRKTQEG